MPSPEGGGRLDHIEALIADAQTWLSDDGVLLVEMNVAQFDAVAVRDGHSSAFALDAVPGDDGQTVVASCDGAPEIRPRESPPARNTPP